MTTLDYEKARITDPVRHIRTIAGIRIICDPAMPPNVIAVLPAGLVSAGNLAWQHVGDGVWSVTVSPRGCMGNPDDQA